MPSNATAPPPPATTGPLAAFGWACYLGVSWTWVIGMFLPTLLVRDVGVAGWIAFAIPNVVGAAAVGFVWRNAAASRWAVARHRVAMAGFSLATLALHGLVIAAWMPAMFGQAWAIAAVAGAAGVALVGGKTHTALALGAAVTFVSLAAIAFAVGRVGFDPDAYPPATTGALPVAWAWLVPGLAAGFLACPHLDLTLHRARQATSPAAGRVAFALGFGGVFAAMIAFSLYYAPYVRPLLDAVPTGDALPDVLRWPLAVHVTMQVAITCGLHLAELRRATGPAGRTVGFTTLAAGVALGVLATRGAMAGWPPADITTSEAAYRLLVLLYALPFPAIVFFVVSPLGRRVTPRLRTIVTIVSVAAGAPFAVLGFVGGDPRWLVGVYTVFTLAAATLWFTPRAAQGAPA